jgi:glycerophosphoryl diester phosphodiesterase
VIAGDTAPRRAIEIVGHGGAGAYHPGNSRRSIETALTLGVDRIECDLQRAADGALVLVHDDAVPLPGGGSRRVRETTTAELRPLLPGLLTLDELVAMTIGRVPLLLDVKRAGYEAEVVAAIRRHGLAGTASVSSTSLSTLRRLRAAFPTMRLGLSTGHWANGVPTRPGRTAARWGLRLLVPLPLLASLRLVGATEAMLQHRIATAPLVSALHAGRYRVNVWTVDDPETIRRAIALGVDGIISNRPDLVRGLLTRS